MPRARDDGQTRPNTASPDNSRRSLLAGAAAVLAAVPFAAHAAQLRAVGALARDAGPDADLLADIAELLAMSRRHDDITDQIKSLRDGDAAYDAAWLVFDADFARFHELRERIARRPAATAGGAKAKAALAIERFKCSYSGMPSDDWDDDTALAYSALLDLMGRASA